jgi:hypothetical protein
MRQTQRAATGIQAISGSVSALCVWLGPVTTPDREPSVGESVSLFREPDAENLPVRFDEREQETGPGQTGLRRVTRKLNPTATGRLQLLRLFSTLLASLTMSAVSRLFEAQQSVHAEERAISLFWNKSHTNQGSLVIGFRSGTQADPCISSVATAIMITTSNSSF